MVVSKLKLKFGSSKETNPLELDVKPITVFVGPNNSGKSKLLQEITTFCNDGQTKNSNLILDDLDFSPITNPEKEVAKYTIKPSRGESVSEGNILFGTPRKRNQYRREDLKSVLENINANKPPVCQRYFSALTLKLDGKERLNHIVEKPAGNLLESPTNEFQVLFQDKEVREEVRRIVYEAFGRYLVINPLKVGRFGLRLSDIAPSSELEEQCLGPTARHFYSQTLDIMDASDGVKAFVGTVISAIAGDPKILLIDEPEAFLHPSLSYKLGKEVSKVIGGNSKSLFVSTHSVDFLMGCIQSGVSLNIVRLTFSNDVPTARVLPNDKILNLMRSPMLRSTGIMNAIFYENVIVTEADADRAFYKEINERLLDSGPSEGILNCLFVNGQNKQTIKDIVRPLRELGISCAAIYDLDIVREGKKPWIETLEALFIPRTTIDSLSSARTNIWNAFKQINEQSEEKNKHYKMNGGVDLLKPADKEVCNNLLNQLEEYGSFTVKKGELESCIRKAFEQIKKQSEEKNKNRYYKVNGGVDLLESEDKEACNNLLNQLEEYGSFTVKKGELESWLQNLSVSAKKSEWLPQIFEKMGEDPTNSNYVRPSSDDVWEFVRNIKSWFANPDKKGIPSS